MVEYVEGENPMNELLRFEGGDGAHVTVQSVAPGSKAFLMGVRHGHAVIALNGRTEFRKLPGWQVRLLLEAPVVLQFDPSPSPTPVFRNTEIRMARGKESLGIPSLATVLGPSEGGFIAEEVVFSTPRSNLATPRTQYRARSSSPFCGYECAQEVDDHNLDLLDGRPPHSTPSAKSKWEGRPRPEAPSRSADRRPSLKQFQPLQLGKGPTTRQGESRQAGRSPLRWLDPVVMPFLAPLMETLSPTTSPSPRRTAHGGGVPHQGSPAPRQRKNPRQSSPKPVAPGGDLGNMADTGPSGIAYSRSAPEEDSRNRNA